jgi:hypothetical protein
LVLFIELTIACCRGIYRGWTICEATPNAAAEELWEPEGASYYNGELILQRPATVDTPCNS